MLLQTLRTRDFDELAQAFPQWDLRFRQLGRGPFRGQVQILQQGAIQVFLLGVNRMLHIEGWPRPIRAMDEAGEPRTFCRVAGSTGRRPGRVPALQPGEGGSPCRRLYAGVPEEPPVDFRSLSGSRRQ